MVAFACQLPLHKWIPAAVLEIILASIGKHGTAEPYFGGFHFSLDFVATITLVLDFTAISYAMSGDEDLASDARVHALILHQDGQIEVQNGK